MSAGEVEEHGFMFVSRTGMRTWTPTLLNLPPARPEALERAGQTFKRAIELADERERSPR